MIYSGLPVISPPPPYAMKKGLIREVASLQRNNLVAFYYLSIAENWPDQGWHFVEVVLEEGGYCINKPIKNK